MTIPTNLQASVPKDALLSDSDRGREAAKLFTFPRVGGVEVALAHVEAAMIEWAMNHSQGVKRRAAEILGISRYALERRLRRIAETLGAKPDPTT